MVVLGQQGHQVDDVHEADPQVRHVVAQQLGRRQRLLGRYVARARQHDVRPLVLGARRCPLPDPRAGRAVAVRLLEREVLQVRLLVDDDQVDVVLAAQAVVHDRQRRVGVRRQPHPDDPRRERQHRVDQPRALVREAVVVVAPARRGEQHVQRRHRRPPRQLLGVLEPLHVLDGHRGRDHGERLVRREHPVPARQRVPLQPALAQVLAEHLHHPAVGAEVVVGRPAAVP